MKPQLNRKTLARISWGPLLLLAAACSDTEADTASPEQDDAAAESGESKRPVTAAPDKPKSGMYQSSNQASEQVADPEAALAAIPERMRPKELLPGLKQKLLVPALEKRGIAMFTDVVTVEPGEDVTFCTYLEGTTDEVMYIHDTQGSQSSFGHHAILQYTTTPHEPGTRRCDPEGLEVQQQGQILGGTGGEGSGAIKLPSNVVSEIPAGSQFVINHHWINASESPVEAQAEMITIPPDSEDDLVVARALAITTVGFELPANQTTEHSTTCMFDHDVKLISAIGHEHSWGTHVKAERVGERAEVVFDHAYDEAMISHPKTRDFGVETPYEIRAGEGVRMACTWNNTTDKALSFPREMCVFFAWQIGAKADGQCIDGKWLSK